MKRRILLPSHKAALAQAKHDHNSLLFFQIQEFNRVAQKWVGIVSTDMQPSYTSQHSYLSFAGLVFGELVQFSEDGDLGGGDPEAYRHVCLIVTGAVSFALPGIVRSQYNYARGHARVYVRVELSVPPLKPTKWWVPAENLRKQNTWAGIQ